MAKEFGWRVRNQNYEYVLIDEPEGEIVIKHRANHDPESVADPIAEMPRRDIVTPGSKKGRGRKKKDAST